MKISWWWAGLSVCLSLSGCAALTVREHFTRFGMPRAAHELDCPPDKLTLVELDQPLDKPLWSGGTLVGVDGCSHRAVYVSTDSGTWILNSVTNTTGKSGDSNSKPDASVDAAKKK